MEAENISFLCWKALIYIDDDGKPKRISDERIYISDFGTDWIDPITGRAICGQANRVRYGSLLWNIVDTDVKKLRNTNKYSNTSLTPELKKELSREWLRKWNERDNHINFNNYFDKNLRGKLPVDENFMNHFLFFDNWEDTPEQTSTTISKNPFIPDEAENLNLR